MKDRVLAYRSGSSSDIIVGILRIIYLVAINTAKDYTWIAVDCWIWSVFEPSLAVMVACGPTLGPLITAFHDRVSTKKISPDNYPSYPGRRQQFSNISDSEYPLQPMFGNYSKADSKNIDSAPAFMRTSQMKDGNQELESGDLNKDVRSPGIRVKHDVRVVSSAQKPRSRRV